MVGRVTTKTLSNSNNNTPLEFDVHSSLDSLTISRYSFLYQLKEVYPVLVPSQGKSLERVDYIVSLALWQQSRHQSNYTQHPWMALCIFKNSKLKHTMNKVVGPQTNT